MRLRIWHLFAILALAAIAIHFSNEATFSSMEVRVAAARELPDSSFPLLNNMSGDCCLLLNFPDSEAVAYVSSSFGMSLAFDEQITRDDIKTLPSRTFQLRFRAKQFLFAEPESPTEAIERRFNDVLWVIAP